MIFTCQSNDPSEFYTDFTDLIPICTELVDVFLFNLFFQLVLGTRFIQESNTVMTLVLIKIVELEIRKSFCFSLTPFNIMVCFKAKARASAYFTKLGWRRGCVFVGGVCLRGGYICVYGWGD